MLRTSRKHEAVLPPGYTFDNPAEARASEELDRRRAQRERNEQNLAGYLGKPEAQHRYRRWLAIRAHLGLI